MSRKYHFINDDVKLDFEIPAILQEIIDDAERADAENNYGAYSGACDAIDIYCKAMCAKGKISQRQWDSACERFDVNGGD